MRIGKRDTFATVPGVNPADAPQVPWALHPEKAEAILGRIVQTVSPSRVIAFGSRARGKPRSESDLDLLIVLRPGEDESGVSARLYRALSGLFAHVDLVVVGAARWHQLRDVPNTVYREAHRYGQTLYADGRVHQDAVAKVSG